MLLTLSVLSSSLNQACRCELNKMVPAETLARKKAECHSDC